MADTPKKRIKIKVAGKPKAVSKKVAKVSRGGTLVTVADGLSESSLKVFDVPIGLLIGHEDNPNQQNEETFGQIVDRIREEGFDEPIHVYPELVKGIPTGKYKIFSGHHRVKAAKMLDYKKVPAVIRTGWDEDRVKIELVSRNSLRGNMNPEKFTKLYSELAKKYEPEELKRMMGLTEKKAFDVLFKQARDQLPPKAKKKLDEAKETIKSVDDLSSVLNVIFKEHGSEVDHSMMVFSFGGKKHTYVRMDPQTSKQLEAIKKQLGELDVERQADFFRHLLCDDQNIIDNVIGKMKSDAQKAKAAS